MSTMSNKHLIQSADDPRTTYMEYLYTNKGRSYVRRDIFFEGVYKGWYKP